MSNDPFFNFNYITEKLECQAFEEKELKLIRHMHEKEKILNNLCEASAQIGMSKSYQARIRECGTILVVDEEENILSANFCKARLCPVCAWKRSLKLYHAVKDVTDSIVQFQPETRFLFLTLTQPNVKAEKLNKEIDEIMYAYKRLRQDAKIKKMSKGMIKSLEITYNEKEDTYHPHLHVVIATSKSYFKRGSPIYIKHETWLQKWQYYKNDTRISNINIKAIKTEETTKAIAEVCKYTVKLSSVADQENIKALAHVMQTIHNRRLFSSSGVFREYARILKYDLEEIANEEKEETALLLAEGKAKFKVWNGKNYKTKNKLS